MGGIEHTFGISGQLYKSNVLLYDRQTESLWSQLSREAVTGPMTGTRLSTYPSTNTTWKRWKARHPDTLVLSTDTGYARDYSKDPYEGYYRSPLAFLGFGRKTSAELPEKELVLGVELGGAYKAYPFTALRVAQLPLTDTVSGQKITIHFHPGSEEAYATGTDGSMVTSTVSYWFVWDSFHPETGIYKPKAR